MNNFQPVQTLLAQWCQEDLCPAISAEVGTCHEVAWKVSLGRQTLQGEPPLPDDSIFLIASPTKPLTATAILLLVERGELQLTDRVADFVPEFATAGKDKTLLVHLLTHTSGLPDQLPENYALREQHAPLEEFVQRTCRYQPDFDPGTKVQYQSMGYLMLGEVLLRVTGTTLPDFLRAHVFDPLDMHDTALGMPESWQQPAADGGPSRFDRLVEVREPKSMVGKDWAWNSLYWRRLGAPWGGVLSSATDLGKLCRHLLQVHRGEPGLLAPATLAAMTENQLPWLPDLPEHSRRTTPWGLGWQLNWPWHVRTFGDLLSSSAYGHWGATGTMLWIDPPRDQYAVLLTSQPLRSEHRPQARFTNMVCATQR